MECACSSSQVCFPFFYANCVAGPLLNPPLGFLSPVSSYLREHPGQCRRPQGGGSKPRTDVTSLLKNHQSLPVLLTKRKMAKAFKSTHPFWNHLSNSTLWGTLRLLWAPQAPPHLPPLLTLSLECAPPATQCFPHLFWNSRNVTPFNRPWLRPHPLFGQQTQRAYWFSGTASGTLNMALNETSVPTWLYAPNLNPQRALVVRYAINIHSIELFPRLQHESLEKGITSHLALYFLCLAQISAHLVLNKYLIDECCSEKPTR